MEENLLLNDNHVSTKSGEFEMTMIYSDDHDDQCGGINLGSTSLQIKGVGT